MIFAVPSNPNYSRGDPVSLCQKDSAPPGLHCCLCLHPPVPVPIPRISLLAPQPVAAVPRVSQEVLHGDNGDIDCNSPGRPLSLCPCSREGPGAAQPRVLCHPALCNDLVVPCFAGHIQGHRDTSRDASKDTGTHPGIQGHIQGHIQEHRDISRDTGTHLGAQGHRNTFRDTSRDTHRPCSMETSTSLLLWHTVEPFLRPFNKPCQ